MISKVQNYSANFGAKIVIRPADNEHIPFLHNKLLSLVKKNGVPAEFKGDIVEISPANMQQNAVEKGLKDLKIKYDDTTKKYKNSILDKAYEMVGSFVEQY